MLLLDLKSTATSYFVIVSMLMRRLIQQFQVKDLACEPRVDRP